MASSVGRRTRILLLVARFYGLILAFLVVPSFALIVSLVKFPTIPWFMLLFAVIPFGLIGLLLVRAALPKRFTVQPNGIPLSEIDAPALFELCRDAAKTAVFTKPFSVYVDLSAGPSSLQYLGFAGIRSRYAIVLGLPALHVLNADELRVVLSYLFAVVGLEKLPEIWLKETKLVLMRILHSPPHAGDTWLAKLLRRYVSQADALLAAQSAQAEQIVAVSLAPVRERLAASAKLFNRFWLNDVTPLLNRGFLPPIGEGFERLIERAGNLTESNGPRSTSLLRSPWIIEQRIASALADTHGTALQQVSWELVPWRVILPSWEAEVQPHAAVLASIHVREIAEYAENRLLELGRKVSPRDRLLSPEQLRWTAARMLAVALALTLRRTGWQLAYEGAGDSWSFRLGIRSLDPFESLDLLASKRILREEWDRLCTDLGLANLPLALG
jgi:hypothetical protein